MLGYRLASTYTWLAGVTVARGVCVATRVSVAAGGDTSASATAAPITPLLDCFHVRRAPGSDRNINIPDVLTTQFRDE